MNTNEAEAPPRSAQDILGPDKDPHLAEDNPFEAMMVRFDYAAELLSLDPGIYRVLRMPEKQLIVSVPIQRDSGEIDVFTGYRVIHNTSRGPGKGGIRFDQRVHLVGLEVHGTDPGPDIREGPGRGLADALRRAGDDDALALQAPSGASCIHAPNLRCVCRCLP